MKQDFLSKAACAVCIYAVLCGTAGSGRRRTALYGLPVRFRGLYVTRI